MASPSVAISVNPHYSLSIKNDPEILSKVVAVYPNHKVISKEIPDLNAFLNFSIYLRDFEKARNLNISISHISEYINSISKLGNCANSCCVFCFVHNNYIFLIVKRISDLIFCNVFHFDNADDLLYHIQSVFIDLKLNSKNDKIVILGNIEEESQIIHKMKIYFANITIESTFKF